MSQPFQFREIKDPEKRWTAYANERLRGKQVKKVQYLTPEDTEAMGWYKRPLVIIFTDDSYIFASMDDEGNDGGTLFGGGAEGDWTFPVL